MFAQSLSRRMAARGLVPIVIAGSVEKLDAVAWLQINVLDRFQDEFKIQLAWLRHRDALTGKHLVVGIEILAHPLRCLHHLLQQ